MKKLKPTYRDAFAYCSKAIAVLTFSELFQVATAVFGASVIGRFADAVFARETEYVLNNLVYLLICIALNVLLVPFIGYLSDVVCIKESIGYDIHMYSQFLKMPYEIGSRTPVGEVKARLESDVIIFRNSLIVILNKSFTMPLALAALTVMMIRLNAVYAAFTAAMALLTLLVPALTKKLGAKYDEETRIYEAEESARSYDIIMLAPFVKLYRLSRKLISDYHEAYQTFRNRTQRRAILFNSIRENIGLYLSVLTNVAVLVFGAYLLSRSMISAGGIMAMAGYFAALLSTMENAGIIISYGERLKRVEKRVELFYSADEAGDAEGEHSLLPLAADGICYSIDENTLLNGISFNIEPGCRIAVVGENGSGKSTLLNIITGLYRAYGGSLRSDGSELRDIPLSDLADGYSFVSQSPFIFSGTVRENVEFGSECVDPAASDAVMRSLGIYDIREKRITARADNLSGGEMQRISLARALLRDRPVMIMDEPSNNLDAECVEWIEEYIKNSGRSIIYVTHDQELAALADRIITVGGEQAE